MGELCIEGDSQSVAELFAAAGMNKARRKTLQQSEHIKDPKADVWEGPHKSSRGARLKELFVKVDKRAPRVGTVEVGSNEELFREFQSVCSNMKVRSVEICRGTDRFRLPKCRLGQETIPLRKTFIMHRETGDIYEFGDPERWLDLPRTRRYAKSKPAKVCVTVFGGNPEQASSSNSPVVHESKSSPQPLPHVPNAENRDSPDSQISEAAELPMIQSVGKKRVMDTSDEPEKRHRGGNTGVDDDDEYVEGFPPRGIAKHGPAFLNLSKEEREWLKRVHHRMGHPDPRKFASFLKDTHADTRIIAGALEYQCDTCSESQTGYSLARPAAIHAHLGFNEVVGMDVAKWTNDVGEKFVFVHFLDEGTLFHLGRRCAEDSESQLACFEETWLSWAGPPKQVYLDPATEYTSEKWLEAMQSEDIELKMTAAESHWQLGRVEAHGRVIKRMLDLMNAETPIRSGEDFCRALRQVFSAKNSMSRIHGFTPEQAVLGIARRLPASVTGGTEASSHALAESEGSEGSAFREALRLRSAARKAFVEADNCSSLRRALLRRSRPVRDKYEVGDWVLYWRKKGGNLRREHGRWFGPARVAMVEGLKVVWLTHANKLIRASPEQLRPASLREWKAVKETDEGRTPLGTWLKKIGHQDYFDLGETIPTAQEVVAGEVGGNLESESLPEPESAPSVISGDVEGTAEPSSNPERPPIPVGGLHIPVPGSDDEDLLFGDVVQCEFGFDGRMWEIDITPEVGLGIRGKEWEVFHNTHVTADEMILLASEQRKKRVEVRLKDLGEREQQLFARAKHKEIKAWLHHGTVRRVAQGKIPDHALMRCRWIYNWKEATGEEPKEDLSDLGCRAKARLVIIGYEDPDIDTVSNDAPTLTKDGRMTVLQAVAAHRWELLSFDVSTAFLHGKGDGRTLGIHPPPELREALGMTGTDQCALDGGAYGRIDAPYLWFCEFRDELLKQGCTQCPLDPCVFGLYTETGNLDPQGNPLRKFHGCLGIHVDDGIAGGDSVFMAMLKRVEARFKFGAFERREFKYTGIHFRQWDDYSIEYDQIEYIERINPVTIEKSRRTQPMSPLTEAEKSSLRSIIGALQYAAVHSRPDISAKVGELQSSVNRATVSELIQANKVLAEAKMHKVSLMVLPIKPELLTFCAFSDASFLSGKQNSAHQGTLIFSTTPELLENRKAIVAPVAWTSKKVPRIVRSTLGAEAAALSNTVDRLMWIRLLWAWIRNPNCDWAHPERLLKTENTSALVTDCKSAYDLLTRTALPQCAEHRTTVECLLIRERLQENCRVRWVSSQAMLADCLTKTMDSQVLRTCLKTGRYTLQDEDHVLKSRSDHRQRLDWVKRQAVVEPPVEAESCQVASCANPAQSLHDFWTWGKDGELIRVHQRPRELKFTPIGVVDCPVDLKCLDSRRVTQIGKNRVEHDFWVGTCAAKNVGFSWTGTTTFYVKGN